MDIVKVDANQLFNSLLDLLEHFPELLELRPGCMAVRVPT